MEHTNSSHFYIDSFLLTCICLILRSVLTVRQFLWLLNHRNVFCLLEMRQSPGIFWLLLNLSSSIKNRRVVSIIVVVVIIVTSLLVKVNYNYFTLYKASSLNLKIIWSKRVSFFVFFRSHKFIRRSHGSRLSVIVRSDAICFYWNEWMKIDRRFLYTNHVQCQQILKSWHKPINKMDLQRDRNCSCWNLCHVRPLSNVEFLMSAEHLF